MQIIKKELTCGDEGRAETSAQMNTHHRSLSDDEGRRSSREDERPEVKSAFASPPGENREGGVKDLPLVGKTSSGETALTPDDVAVVFIVASRDTNEETPARGEDGDTTSLSFAESAGDPPSVANSLSASVSSASTSSSSQSKTVIQDESEKEGHLPLGAAEQVSVNDKSKNVIQTQINRLILLPDFEH